MSLNKYKIIIHTSRKNTLRAEFKDIPYTQMPRTRTGDTIVYLKQKIIIYAIRNGVFKDWQILERRTNTIYEQITKSLLYLYTHNGARVWVGQIDIQRNSLPASSYKLGKDSQPIVDDFSLSFRISNAVLGYTWRTDPSGYNYRAVLSHFLRAVGAHDRYYRFERYWRAFEQLCMWHSKQIGVTSLSEFAALRHMRAFMITNPTLMIESSNVANKIGVHKLKRMFRWRDYIDNCFSVGGQSGTYQTYKDYFVLQYSDLRVIGLHKKILPFRESQLRRFGYYSDVKNHIDHWLLPSNRCLCDVEVVALLCCRYCYFLRNKMFHGEVADFTFRFSSHLDDDDAVDILNELLRSAILDVSLRLKTT